MKHYTRVTRVEVMIIVFMIVMLAAAVLQPVFGVDRDGTTRVLQGAGYTDITITGYRWFAGDKGDFYHSGFEAKSPTGQRVSGTVTRGMIFKGATIRFD